jgi:dipeptidyl aminopeptidase/acylaminoacyl peptidase
MRASFPRVNPAVSRGLLIFLTLLLAACGGSSTQTPTTTPTTGATATTVPTPPTRTDCPANGGSRSAVMTPFVPGNHPTVVYVSQQAQGANPATSILVRYDVTTRSKATIVSVPHSSISDAQVSADGQWILFTTTIAHRTAIQLVRLDGQGLQTVYCSAASGYNGASALQWSPDQKYVAFKEGLDVSLLDLAAGTYKLAVPASNGSGSVPRAWLDNTHLYLTPFGASEPLPLQVSLLDISSATVKQVLNSSTLCGDFVSSGDSTHLFTSTCSGGIPTTEGPSSIQVQPAASGEATTIYRVATYGITALRVASGSTLLFIIHNTGVTNVDTSHNGLWKVNTDGSGLTRLSTDAADEATVFRAATRSTWSTVSRDGESYVVEVIQTSSPDAPSFLLIGSMSGATPETLATGSLNMVGWATF